MARRIGRLPLPIATPPFTHEAGLHGRRKEAAVESLVLQTAIGLTFIFATFAAAVSAISEAVARYLGLRGEYLLRGVRSAVDGKSDFRLPMRAILPWNAGRLITKNAADVAKSDPDNDEAMVALIISHPLVAASAKGAAPPCRAGDRAMSNKERRSLPSYLSGQTFSRALVDILVSEVDANRADSHAEPAQSRQLGALRSWAGSRSPRHEHLAGALRPLLTAAHDLKELETSIAGWYEEHMARVSGWYKRHVKWISLGIGLVLVVAFNANAIKIADALYSDQALSTSVVAEATRASACGSTDPAKCLADLRGEVGKLRGTGLPIGWGTVPACATRPSCSWLDRHGFTNIGSNGSADVWAFLLVLLGWAVMILALLPGARFWFDLLSKFGSLRSTGPKPAT